VITTKYYDNSFYGSFEEFYNSDGLITKIRTTSYDKERIGVTLYSYM